MIINQIFSGTVGNTLIEKVTNKDYKSLRNNNCNVVEDVELIEEVDINMV